MYFNTINNVDSSGEIFVYLPIQSEILRYTGSSLTPKFDGFDSRIMTRSGNLTATIPGIYTTTFTLVNGFKWWDGTTEPKETFFEIKRRLLTAFPSISTTKKIYNGQNITASISNTTNCTISNNIAHKNAGTYWVSVTPNNYYAFPDDSTAPIILKYTIEKLAIGNSIKDNILLGQKSAITYNGKAQTPSISYSSSNSIFGVSNLILDGDITGINAGDYIITVKPAENYSWDDGSTGVLSIPWSIQPAKLKKPSGTFTTVFNERKQSPVFTGYIPELMVLEGNAEETSPGEYSVNIRLKDENNYTWDDGTRTPVTLTWSITKQSITKPVLLQNAFSYTGYAQTVELSNCNMSLVTLSGTYSATYIGFYTFTVKPKDGYQWDDSTTDDLTFSWLIISNNKKPSLHIYSSWDEIAAVTKSGFAELVYEIGSFKEISFNEGITTISFGATNLDIKNYTFLAYLIGIDHNSNYEGIRRTHWCIGRNAALVVDVGFNSSKMNSTGTNVGGWANSPMNTTYLVDFYNALSDDLKAVIADTTKYTDNTGNKSNTEADVTSSTSKMFLMSEYEVLGVRSFANPYEQDKQEQYDYYKNGNSGVRKYHSGGNNYLIWFTRSPYYNSATGFCCINISGKIAAYTANNIEGAVPCFTIA